MIDFESDDSLAIFSPSVLGGLGALLFHTNHLRAGHRFVAVKAKPGFESGFFLLEGMLKGERSVDLYATKGKL